MEWVAAVAGVIIGLDWLLTQTWSDWQGKPGCPRRRAIEKGIG